MREPNEFWLSYHQLLKAYEAEGQTPEARSEHIIEQFNRMPASVRQHIVDGMNDFLSFMAELLIAVESPAQGERKPTRQKWR